MVKVGDNLGRFTIRRELGRGSHGAVYAAEDTLLGESVALKLLQPMRGGDDRLQARFKRELVLTRRVSHPGVCRLYDLHTDDDLLYISMQLITGDSLANLLRKRSPSSLEVLHILRGLCSALGAAHAEGVVHRDLKPANIMITDDQRVVILDFGIATASGVGQLTKPGEALGSVPFIPPEVWKDEPAGPAGDQYAVGVTGFIALARRLPYPGETPLDVFDAIKGPRPTIWTAVPDVDPELEEAVLKAMAVAPADRFPDIGAFDAALASIERRLKGGAPAPVVMPPVSSSSSSSSPSSSSSSSPRSELEPPSELSLSPSQESELSPTPALTTAAPPLEATSPVPRHEPTVELSPVDEAPETAESSAVISLQSMLPSTITSTITSTIPSTTEEAPSLEGLDVDGGQEDRLPQRAPRVLNVEHTQLVRRRLDDQTQVTPVPGNDDIEGREAGLQSGRGPLVAVVAVVFVLLTILVGWRASRSDEEQAAEETVAQPGTDRVPETVVAAAGDTPAGVADVDVDREANAANTKDEAKDETKDETKDEGAGDLTDEPAADLELALADLDVAPPAFEPDLAVVDEAPGHDGGKAKASARPAPVSSASFRALVGASQQKGIRGGDIPAMDRALSRARQALKARDAEALARAVAAGEAALAATAVDKDFVSKKLGRFNALYDTLEPSAKAALKAATREILRLISKGEWQAANASLNEAFTVARKARR